MSTLQNQRQKSNINTKMEPSSNQIQNQLQNTLQKHSSQIIMQKMSILKKISTKVHQFSILNQSIQVVKNKLQSFEFEAMKSLSFYVQYGIPMQYFPSKERELVYRLARLCNIPQYSDYQAMNLQNAIQQPNTSIQRQKDQSEKLQCSIKKSPIYIKQNQKIQNTEENQNSIAAEIVEAANEKNSEDNDDKTSVGVSIQNQKDQKQNSNRTLKPTFMSMNQFIQSFKRLPLNEQKSNVSRQVIESVNKLNSWKKKQDIVKIYNPKKDSSNKNQKNKNYDKSRNQQGSQMTIQVSSRSSLADENQSKKNISSSVTIIIGDKMNTETKQMREMIKDRAEDNFKTKKQKEEQSLSDLQKAVIEIHFQLNKVSPGNIDQIAQVLKPYITGKKETVKNKTIPICLGLIKLIIQKCQTQHKRYIGIYAQLLKVFSKIPKTHFVKQNSEAYQMIQSLSKGNKFKNMLVEAIQQQFHEKLQSRCFVQENDIKGAYCRSLLGFLRLIADLIKQKVLSKRIVNICISNMLLNLMKTIKEQKNCTTKIYKTMQQSYIEVFIQGLLQFIQDLKQYFDYKIVNLPQEGNNLNTLIPKIKLMLSKNFSKQKDNQLFQSFCLLKIQDYILLLDLFNESSYRQARQTTQTDMLIQNWKQNINNYKEQLQNDLYEIKKEIDQEFLHHQQDQHHNKDHDAIIKAGPRIRQILQQGQSKNQENRTSCINQLSRIFKQGRNEVMINLRCLLRIIGDGKKQNVSRNVQNLKKAIYKLQDVQLWNGIFVHCWKKQFEYLSTQFTDMKQLTQVIGQLIHITLKLSDGDIKQFIVISNDEDEIDFMDQILEKYYLISKTHN